MIGLYFSADWCPPCHRVTPHLAAIYRSFKSQHPRAPDWEVLFVSSDRDEAAFRQHHATMPWPALPFRDRAAKDALSRLCKVRGSVCSRGLASRMVLSGLVTHPLYSWLYSVILRPAACDRRGYDGDAAF